MSQVHKYPVDLAKLVRARLAGARDERPSLDVLTKLFDTMHFASMRTEEGQPIACALAYIDPDNPRLPHNSLSAAWSCVSFASRLPFDDHNLVKLARAAPSSASSLVIFADTRGELFIWGMIDRIAHRDGGETLESVRPVPNIGLFHAEIVGPGHLVVYQGLNPIGTYRHGLLMADYPDVLRTGPVAGRLNELAGTFMDHARRSESGSPPPAADWNRYVTQDFVKVLSGIILGIQRSQHGGALLLVPEGALDELVIRYRLDYYRLRNALQQYHLRRRESYHLREDILAGMHAARGEAGLHELRHRASMADMLIEGLAEEILGCLRFIVPLALPDGLVVLDDTLVVKGFGAMITTQEMKRRAFSAGDAEGAPARLTAVDMNVLGTRHLSMMRYCAAHPQSLGFVVSQDGDVHAMMAIGDRLVYWENIRL
jgi:hypothetical protein